MNAPPVIPRRLRLESLETRTLLAADLADPYGLVADFNLALHALSGTGDYHASFSTNFGNHQLVITGSTASSLTIDLSQLPSFITNLSISSFGSVNMTGTDHVDNLILNSVGTVAAEGLSVDLTVVAKNVDTLSLAYVGQHAVVTGDEMSLNVRSFGEVSDILSEVGTLTFTTEASHIDIFAIPTSAQPVQTLRLTDASEVGRVYWHADVGSTVHVILPAVDPGSSTPDTPPPATGGSDPGPSTNDPQPSDPGSLVVVTTPYDERTRAFLEQLHQLLHSSDASANQQLLEILKNGEDSSSRVPALSSSDFFSLAGGHLGPAIPDEDFGHNPGTFLPVLPEISKFTHSASEPMFWGAQDPVFVRSKDPILNRLPDALVAPGLVNVEISWPVSLATPNLPRPESSRGSANGESHNLTLGERVQVLGSYVVERLTAEFSPGQQSLVLLIDPQPTRAASSSRKSEIDRNSTNLPIAATAPVLYV